VLSQFRLICKKKNTYKNDYLHARNPLALVALLNNIVETTSTHYIGPKYCTIIIILYNYGFNNIIIRYSRIGIIGIYLICIICTLYVLYIITIIIIYITELTPVVFNVLNTANRFFFLRNCVQKT